MFTAFCISCDNCRPRRVIYDVLVRSASDSHTHMLVHLYTPAARVWPTTSSLSNTLPVPEFYTKSRINYTVFVTAGGSRIFLFRSPNPKSAIRGPRWPPTSPPLVTIHWKIGRVLWMYKVSHITWEYTVLHGNYVCYKCNAYLLYRFRLSLSYIHCMDML